MRMEYMLTRDIDWFAKVGPYYMHFASNGSILPIKMKRKDLNKIQNNVVEIREEEEQRINEQHMELLKQRGSILEAYQERYLESFKLFASKGFYSFDYDSIEKRYKLVAMPCNKNGNRRLSEMQFPILNEKQEWIQDCISQIRRIE